MGNDPAVIYCFESPPNPTTLQFPRSDLFANPAPSSTRDRHSAQEPSAV
jgi:hypothetical protein